jgi:hypothetical protein
MAQGFTTPLPIPLPVAMGGTGQTQSTGSGAVVLESANKVVLLGTATASASSVIDFTGLDGASYSEFFVVFNNILGSTGTPTFLCRISTGSGFFAVGYNYVGFRWAISSSAAEGGASKSVWAITSEVVTTGITANLNEVNGIIRFTNPSTTTPIKTYQSDTNYISSGAVRIGVTFMGECSTNSAPIDGIRFLMTAGTINSGTFYLYGVKNS